MFNNVYLMFNTIKPLNVFYVHWTNKSLINQNPFNYDLKYIDFLVLIQI